jgi:glutaminyl-tRNA synthetase
LAEKYNAPIVLRFDDTNPEKEEQRYINAIKDDVSWLGFSWDEERFASDYFEQLYLWALDLIKNNKAYVDSLMIQKKQSHIGQLQAKMAQRLMYL